MRAAVTWAPLLGGDGLRDQAKHTKALLSTHSCPNTGVHNERAPFSPHFAARITEEGQPGSHSI